MSRANTLAITLNGFLIDDLGMLTFTLSQIIHLLERKGMTEIRLDISDVTDDLE